MDEQQPQQQPSMAQPQGGQDQPKKSGMGTWLIVLVVIVVIGVVVWMLM
ncbi:MAG: hypothetical protein HZC01_00410 [Candidatus Kerfeldbacteria bacterium]|nr:hypothetical protein [Candidatus Kerfeldbacteria bacterium]